MGQGANVFCDPFLMAPYVAFLAYVITAHVRLGYDSLIVRHYLFRVRF